MQIYIIPYVYSRVPPALEEMTESPVNQGSR